MKLTIGFFAFVATASFLMAAYLMPSSIYETKWYHFTLYTVLAVGIIGTVVSAKKEMTPDSNWWNPGCESGNFNESHSGIRQNWRRTEAQIKAFHEES